MYESPIETIYENVQTQFEDAVLKAVQKVGINVDKEELVKALAYDRGQYEKGYADRDAEIVRCKDCKWCHKAVFAKYSSGEEIERCYCDIHKRYTIDDYFCGDGERRDDAKHET